MTVEQVKKDVYALAVLKNGPRLWALDWVEVKAGTIRDFNGLKARWVMRFDVPPEMVGHEGTPYTPTTGKRSTHFGFNQGSPALLLDDPEGNTWCRKPASLIVDPKQKHDDLEDLGGRLKLPAGWANT